MKSRTRVSIVAVVIILLAGLYAGGWFYLAGMVKSRADTFLARLTGRKIEAACTDLRIGGFPFGIGLTCDAVRARREEHGKIVTVSAGALHSNAAIIHPGRVVSSLDGPLKATGPYDTTLDAKWQSLSTSTDLWTDGLTRGDVHVTDLSATVANPRLPATLDVAADTIDAQTSRRDADLDVVFSAVKLALSGAGLPDTLPASNVSGAATFKGLGYLLKRGTHPGVDDLRGTSGRLNRLTAKLDGGATLSAEGPFSIDERGRINGAFKIRIEDVNAWQTTMSHLLPQAQKQLNDASNMLRMLAGKDDTVSMKLTANDGQLMLGIVPIAKLPPI